MAEAAGGWQNGIPKQGGDPYHGMVFSNFSNTSLQSTGNVSDPSKASTLPRNWDFPPPVGGPLRKGKAWFFGSYGNWGVWEHPPGAVSDTNPLDFVYRAPPN